jgi:hypothetical protein
VVQEVFICFFDVDGFVFLQVKLVEKDFVNVVVLGGKNKSVLACRVIFALDWLKVLKGCHHVLKPR